MCIQCGAAVRVRNLNADDLGSNLQLRRLNRFVLCDPRGKFTTLCKYPGGITPISYIHSVDRFYLW